MKTGLVLSGGGAKGAYEIGVYKALKEIGEEFAVVTGASIGSLNALFVAQDELDAAINGWRTFTNAESLFSSEETDAQAFKKILVKNAFKGGVSTDGLKAIVASMISEEKIRKSSIRYGCVIVNAKTFKHREVTIDEIPEGQLFDYAIASCSLYPIFKLANIDDQKYMDGGWYDNIPINLAIDMGAERVIAVDLKAPGNNHRKPKKPIEIIKIKPSRKTESIILFDEKRVEDDMKLGYLDTLKVYGLADGKYYFFKTDGLNEKVKEIQVEFLKVIDGLKDLNEPLLMLPIPSRNYADDKCFRSLIDQVGHARKLDSLKLYDYEGFNKAALKALKSKKDLKETYLKIEEYLTNKTKIKVNINRNFYVACYLMAVRRIYG